MSAAVFSNMRVWAMLTGLVLAGWYFGELWMDVQPTEVVAMLLMGIGGFELFLFGQDFWLKRLKGRGHG